MPSLGELCILAYRETLAMVAELINKSRSPTPTIWIFHFVNGQPDFLQTMWLQLYQFTKLGYALELQKLGGVYIHFCGSIDFPWR
jgi:hypothetical protein